MDVILTQPLLIPNKVLLYGNIHSEQEKLKVMLVKLDIGFDATGS